MKNQPAKSKLPYLLASSGLLLTFCLAAVRPARAQATRDTVTVATVKDSAAPAIVKTEASNAQPGHTYWKNHEYSAVMDLWECPERGICAKLHSFDPQEKKTRELAGKILKKDPAKLTDSDFEQICGYEAQLSEMTKVDPRTWNGKIWIKQKNSFYGIAFGLPGEGDPNLHVDGRLTQGVVHAIFFGDPFHVLHKTITLEPVVNPPPACHAPPGWKSPLQ
jgi:hypothetical protein